MRKKTLNFVETYFARRGNMEASAFRAAIAQEMGYRLRRTRRQSGSARVRIDLPNP